MRRKGIENTDRKLAENALHESENRLKRAQAIAHLGSWDLDVVENRLTWSDEVYRIFGLKPGEFSATYEAFLERVHPDDRAAVDAAYSGSLRENRDTYEIEHRVIRKDTGEIRVVLEKCEHLRDAAGRIVRSIGMVHDITERKSLERRIEYLARFPDENPNPVLRIEADGALKYANAAAVLMLKKWKLKTGGKAPRLWRDLVATALQKGSPIDYETEVGKEAFSFCITPISKHGYANLYGRRITELKAAHEREKRAVMLLAASQTARDTVEAMAGGVILLDMDGTVRSVNPALVRLTGYSKKRLEGRNAVGLLPLLVAPSDVSLARSALAAAMRGEVPQLKEMTLISKTGDRLPVIPRASFIKNASGMPSAIVLTIQDITEHKKAERRNQIVTTLLALFAKKTSRKDYLDAVVRVIRQWSGCRCVGVRIRNEKGDVPYESYVGFSDEFVRCESSLFLDKDPCVCTRVIAGSQDPVDMPCLTGAGSFRCDNTFKFMKALSGKAKKRFRGVCVSNGFASLCVSPIRYHDAITGAIHLADEKEGVISEEMALFAESTLSPIIGEAMHRFGMETDLRSLSSRLTLAEEHARRQLAIALHDTVGQTLAMSKIKLGEVAEQLTDRDPKKALAEIREMFETAVRQTRTLSFELSPPILYELGLGPAIEWMGEEFAKRHDFTVSFKGTARQRNAPEAVNVLFFQSARELLTNIAKHAGAGNVRISLRGGWDRIAMEIVDDGIGMDIDDRWAAVADKKSLGLFSIRERMKDIGGAFELQSRLGHGTRAMLTAPISDISSAGKGMGVNTSNS